MSCHGGYRVILSITNYENYDDDDGDDDDDDDDVFHLFPIVNAVINSVTADDRSPC